MDEWMFYNFCGNETLFNQTLLYADIPEVTSCFLDTLPVWVGCGFGWLTAIPLILYTWTARAQPLPFSHLHVVKIGMCIALIGLEEMHFNFRQLYGDTCHGPAASSSAAQLALGLKLATFMLMAGLQQVQKRFGQRTSGVIFVFWFLLLCTEVPRLYSYATMQNQCGTQAVFYVYLAAVFAQFVTHCFSEKSYQDKQKEQEIKACPYDEASVFNRITYSWITRLVTSVYRKKFTRDQMFGQARNLKSSVCGKRLEKTWKHQMEKTKKQSRPYIYQASYLKGSLVSLSSSSGNETTPILSKRKPSQDKQKQPTTSLLLVLAKTFWFELLECLFFHWICLGIYFISPIVLRFLIDYIDNKTISAQPLWFGVMYTILLVLLIEASSITFHVLQFHTNACGVKMKSALLYVIYNKALTVSKSENDISVGEVVTLMSVDCQKVLSAMDFFYVIPNLSLYIGVAMWELWGIVGGVATISGILVWLMTYPLSCFIISKQNKIQKRILENKGNRTRLIDEMLRGIKVLKMYTWELSFIQKVNKIRKQEVEYLRRNAILMAIMTVIANHSQFIIHFVMMAVCLTATDGHFLSASTVFVSYAITTITRAALTMMPTCLDTYVQANIALKRIGTFLSSSDINEDTVIHGKVADVSDFIINVKDGEFTWGADIDKPSLVGLNFTIRPGQLVAVVGHCGSGKSSLLAALLGEMRKLDGTVTVKGSVAYVPQEAWIQNMTLRDNILFGREMNSNRYWKVIDTCCLKPDLALLDAGDMTEIGEKGANISGGQKQRISLARAAYSNADIYILDDPLSAVDAHVGKDLFKNVISHTGVLKNKTRLLVTHAVHWLPLVDNILVMNDGTISEFGTYDELMTHNGDFAQFLLQYLVNEELPAEVSDDPEIRWLRANMLEQVESVTSDGGGGASSDGMTSRIRIKQLRKKKIRKRTISRTISTNQSMIDDPLQIPPLDVKRLITEETVPEGSVKLKVITDYIRAMGRMSAAFSMLGLFLYQSLSVFSTFWLSFWTEDPYLLDKTNLYVQPNYMPYTTETYGNFRTINGSFPNSTGSITSSTEGFMDTNGSYRTVIDDSWNSSSLSGMVMINQEYVERSDYYVIVYVVLGIIQGLLLYLSYFLVLTKLIKASSVLHDAMLISVLRSPMSFFDTVPIGRILNRFSSDIDAMDSKLPEAYRLMTNVLMTVMAGLVVMVICTPSFIFIIVPALVAVGLLMHFYLPTIRKMRRLEAVSRSPVFNHCSETLSGSSVIRAYRSTSRFVKEASQLIDKNLAYYNASNCATRWIGVRLELLGNLILMGALLIAVLSDTLNGAELGLSVNYAVTITFGLNVVVWTFAEAEINAVSAERVQEYSVLPSEADWESHMDPPDEWPTAGTLSFQEYSTRYRPGLDLVLKGVTFSINHGEKVGVVGRTGAGKSSLTLSLFRIIEASGGQILIDGVNIAQLGLHKLRSKFTILPQDPILFSGSLRMNVDPVHRFTDEEIWKAIECAHLKKFTKQTNQGLDYDCGESGQNLSVGQRQLICLARTLLNKTKILILDEATAAVDMATDDLIQQTIRTQFSDCTILTIAHRLNTIMDYDRVIVLDKGKVKEFASPKDLLKDKDGIFHAMAKDAGLA